jgi:hypothetical protein
MIAMVRLLPVLGCSLFSFSCLPADTRTPPGKLTMTVSPSEATLHGFTTDDNWAVQLDRVLVGIGHTALGSDCTNYSEARYYRVLDLSAGSGQVLSFLYGLGTCDVMFRMAPPDADTVLGQGVTDADQVFMRTAGSDSYFADAGVALDVKGSAVHEGITESFHWSFRQNIRFTDCEVIEDGHLMSGVTLHSNDAVAFDIVVETEALFRDNVDATQALLQFAHFAAADRTFGNGDGIVTLDEIAQVPVVIASPSGGNDTSTHVETWSAPDGGAGAPNQTTFEDFVYLLLVPTIPRFRGVGHCVNHPRTN